MLANIVVPEREHPIIKIVLSNLKNESGIKGDKTKQIYDDNLIRKPKQYLLII
jgi:hypothetical protein